MAHRDDAGTGPGGKRQRLRVVGRPSSWLAPTRRRASPSGRTSPGHDPLPLDRLRRWTVASGPRGSPRTRRELVSVIAVINLDAVAGVEAVPGSSWNGDTPRSWERRFRRERPRAQVAAERRIRPHAGLAGLRQLIDLGFPYSRYEQAPFVKSRRPGGERSPPAADRPPSDGLGDVGSAASHAGPPRPGRRRGHGRSARRNFSRGVALTAGPASYVFLGTRIVRGWAIELVLNRVPDPPSSPQPFRSCFARCRLPADPGLLGVSGAYLSRLAFWALVLASF